MSDTDHHRNEPVNRLIVNNTMVEQWSQLGQDVYALYTIHQGKKDGYFVDVGAYDGKSFSNTYLLEKVGWKGICVEPHPLEFKLMKKYRKKSIHVRAAVYSKSNLEFEFASAGMLSGITSHIDCHTSVTSKATKMYKVKTKTLTDILNEAKAPKIIDFLSIDTEGSELHVLQGIDFEKYTFKYITIEHNFVEPRRTQMRSILESNGYLFHRQNQWDDDYIHASLSEIPE